MSCVCFGCNSNCYNPYESFGEICVSCGCCAKDKKIRYRARYELFKRLLKDSLHFEMWAEDERLLEIQETNVLADIHYYESMIKRYEKLLKAVEE